MFKINSLYFNCCNSTETDWLCAMCHVPSMLWNLFERFYHKNTTNPLLPSSPPSFPLLPLLPSSPPLPLPPSSPPHTQSHRKNFGEGRHMTIVRMNKLTKANPEKAIWPCFVANTKRKPKLENEIWVSCSD